MRADDVLVLERIARLEVEVRLGLHDPRGHAGHGQNDHGSEGQDAHRADPLRTTRRAPSVNLTLGSITGGIGRGLGGQGRQDVRDPGVELVGRPRVHVDEVGTLRLLAVGEEPRLAIVLVAAPPRFAKLRGGSHDDDLVEPRLAAHLVQQRHLRHADGRGTRKLPELLPPFEVLARDERVQELLEPVEGVAVAEHAEADALPIGHAVVVEHVLAETLDERPLHVGIRLQKVMDDLVARHRRCPVAAERGECGALASADATGDGDRERP